MIKRIKELFHFGEDAASEAEIIEYIERGVNFRGAKLWILIIAVFVASLGLNTNSAAVIIGAMLISPLMGPIIGMGLGVGIYDFDLLRRSWKNYIIATIFSILTATTYFLITPFNAVQSELLARTSPTIYDVLIALCGGLAGIIALSSKSQRTGNVIPGVAIATALMPPLCTVGFGLATANWTFAAGAFYLFLINTIFIALATFIGAMFIMKFEKKASIEKKADVKVKRTIYIIAFVTIIPAIILTIGMVRENYFEQRVSRFIQNEVQFQMTHVISHRTDFKNKSFDVVLIGQEVDSASLQNAKNHLPLYKLDGVEMRIIQDRQSQNSEALLQSLRQETRDLDHAEAVIAQQQHKISELEAELSPFTVANQLSPQLMRELKVICPQAQSVTSAIGTTAQGDSILTHSVFVVTLDATLNKEAQQKLTDWLRERTNHHDAMIVFN